MSTCAPLALSLGDPAGIAPELIAEAWARREEFALPTFFVVGGANLLEAAAATRGLKVKTARLGAPEEAACVFGEALPVLGEMDCPYSPGEPQREGALAALTSLSMATKLTIAGKASALVTGPIAKSHLATVGFSQPGQTEFVADACEVAREDAVMMLAGPSLRTVPLTVHTALAEVPGLLSTDLIVRRARIVAQALKRDFGIGRPRLAICGLNPHAGEDGRFGSEEREIIAPAIAALVADGIEATGPHAADALFAPHHRDSFDVAIAMYHDQALIPIKTLDFDEGVNVTVGLPIVRTSPDHGTAYAIAGRNEARPGAMIAAIRMAGECAKRRG
ncbi:MAG: 4-hydroxythreonine-4-phosphate dehydrogenase PdxA [Sphingomonadaceae bacterium]